MKNKKTKRKVLLRTQLIFTYVILLTMIITFISIYVYKSMFGVVIKNTEDVVTNNLKQAENNIMRFQSEMESVLYAIYFNQDVNEFAKSYYDTSLEGITLRKRVMDYFDETTVVHRQIKSIFIKKSSGYAIGSQSEYSYNSAKNLQELTLDDTEVGMPPIWKIQEQSLYEGAIKQLDKKYYISVSKTFKIPNNNELCQIQLIIETALFCELFKNYTFSETSELYVYSNDGHKIYNNKILQLKEEPSFFSIKSEGSSGSFIYDTKDIDKQIVFSDIKNTDWKIIQEIPIKQYTRQVSIIRRNVAIIILVCIIVSVVFSIVFVRNITVPMDTLMRAMKKTKSGEIGYQIQEQYNSEFSNLITYFNSMSTSIQELIVENKAIEKQKMDFTMNMLKSQINPHFMFNTLNMIKWMAISQDSTNISQALEKLMAVLKPVFKENNNYCQLSEEIEYANNYVQLINLRFGGRILLVANIDDETMGQTVLRFILQPFIENCVKYGQNDENAIEIKILVTLDENITICISDNGVGINEQTLADIRNKLADNEGGTIANGDKIGIANVNMRIQLSYGFEYGVAIDSVEGEGTTVIIKLPKI